MTQDFESFIAKIYKKTGLDLSLYKRKQMERRIRSFAKSNNKGDLNDFYILIDKDLELYKKFLNHLTINVSEFFRNPAQWQTLRNTILPKLIEKNQNLKVWSAGCSTGEEPYTMAILLNETFPNVKYTIHATDFDKEVLNKAQVGVYNEKAVMNVEQAKLKKYFTPQGLFYQIKPDLKKNIKFSQQNLLKDKFDTNYDLILCRNVVIYFTEESKFELYKRFYNSLKPGGIFFTGNTEQIFKAKEIGFGSIAAFFYQRPHISIENCSTRGGHF